MMTRKDYIATAAILRGAMENANKFHGENTKEAFVAIESAQLIAEHFASMFANDNPNFDDNKFFDAIHKI